MRSKFDINKIKNLKRGEWFIENGELYVYDKKKKGDEF